MTTQHIALFDTEIGPCGIAWGENGVLGIQLPEGRADETRARLQHRFPLALETQPTAAARRAVESITALLRGERSDLAAIALDMEGVPEFHRRVYEATRTIPPGGTLSYGEIAARLGAPGSARAVGQALGRNPFAIVVPCHRVLAANGKMGGFSANGGVTTKLRLLSIEGAQAANQLALFAGDGSYGFDPDTAIAHLRQAEPAFASVIDAVGGFRMELKRTPSIFVALAEAIVYQQLHAKAAATIYARLCALFPRAHEGPSPAQLARAADEKLRSAGLSQAKMLALQDLARRSLAGEIPSLAEAHAMDDAELLERLTAVRGIGRWTVEMLLMFRLGRPDVLPADDYGVRQGFAVLFKKRELPARKDLEKRGERWRPYRTVASWYLWRAVELEKSIQR